MFSISMPQPDFEGMRLRALERHERAKAEVTAPGMFIGASLGAWLQHAEAAGLPTIAATKVASIPRQAFLRFDEVLPEYAAVWPDFERVRAGAPQGSMLRWDHCSSLDIKGDLADGVIPNNEARTNLHPGDPRAYDLLMEYPSDDLPVWQRPWVDAKMIDGFPVEFRVFVADSQLLGIASYYPQRPLPDSADIRAHVEECRYLAATLVAHLDAEGIRPWMPNYTGKFDPTRVSATLDFLVDVDGNVVFIEAGPPFGAGAHPCAFVDCDAISGVALALAPGATLR